MYYTVTPPPPGHTDWCLAFFDVQGRELGRTFIFAAGRTQARRRAAALLARLNAA